MKARGDGSTLIPHPCSQALPARPHVPALQ